MSETAQKFVVRVPGENGAGEQVFEADSVEELQSKLSKAQEHATRKIREQEDELRRLKAENDALLSAPDQKIDAPEGFDRNYYLQLFASDPVGAQRYLLSFEDSWPKELRDEFTTVSKVTRSVAQSFSQQQANAEFAMEHPEILSVLPSQQAHIAKTLAEIVTNSKWEYSKDNLEKAYVYAKEKGLLKLPGQKPAEVVPREETPTVIAPSGGSAPSSTEHEFEVWAKGRPLEEVRAEAERRARARQ